VWDARRALSVLREREGYGRADAGGDHHLRRERGPLAAQARPAIYELAREKLLSEKFVLVGYARSKEKKDPRTKQVVGPMTDEQYRKDCVEAIRKHARNKPIDEELLSRIQQNIFYVAGGYDSPDDQARLAEKLAQLDKSHQTGGNRLFYMSTPPEAFEGIIRVLGERERNGENGKGWSRLIVEKPVRHRSEDRAGAEQAALPVLARGPDLPHRPLPRQRGVAEHHGDAVRQRDLRADLEPQLHRPRADHR
jgi:hypothetical protein